MLLRAYAGRNRDGEGRYGVPAAAGLLARDEERVRHLSRPDDALDRIDEPLAPGVGDGV